MYTLKEPPKYFDVLGWFFIYLITEITRCSSPFKIPIEQFTSVVANYIWGYRTKSVAVNADETS